MKDARKQWLATRRTGIAGTDAAAILGLSPWKSAMDVWLEKRGLAEERDDPDRDFLLDLGQLMEPVLADLYYRETGRITTQGILTRHPQHPLLLGTPDRICRDEPRGVELKTENLFSDQFGEPGTDDVPAHYLIQCCHYMCITGLPVWDVAMLHGGARFAIYTIHRDAELEQQMVEQLLEWWHEHIVKDKPPDVDSSTAWKIYLHSKHPSEFLPMKDLPAEHEDLMKELGRIRMGERVIDAMRNRCENKLKQIIGDHEGVYSPAGRVTWKKTKDSKVVDWEGAYFALKNHIVRTVAAKGVEYQDTAVEFAVLAEKCLQLMTTEKPGVRRFLFTPKKGALDGTPNNVIEIGTATPRAIEAAIGNREFDPGGPSEGGDRSPLLDGGKTPA